MGTLQKVYPNVYPATPDVQVIAKIVVHTATEDTKCSIIRSAVLLHINPINIRAASKSKCDHKNKDVVATNCRDRIYECPPAPLGWILAYFYSISLVLSLRHCESECQVFLHHVK